VNYKNRGGVCQAKTRWPDEAASIPAANKTRFRIKAVHAAYYAHYFLRDFTVCSLLQAVNTFSLRH
jgi:hypothetical protein